ncbi:hypothetical protein NP233_g830 [Leucocoprinus birnbaumii]|uniref:phosphoinositide 5-phosphatase n=1 Tax=Leucocoprinus birnbaumii TaxID=56174 RepID=A0AAD5W144_9AGAR|nr:hypothetical protein NP233_g830 [Leucocoprinus birnbaumii]
MSPRIPLAPAHTSAPPRSPGLTRSPLMGAQELEISPPTSTSNFKLHPPPVARRPVQGLPSNGGGLGLGFPPEETPQYTQSIQTCRDTETGGTNGLITICNTVRTAIVTGASTPDVSLACKKLKSRGRSPSEHSNHNLLFLDGPFISFITVQKHAAPAGSASEPIRCRTPFRARLIIGHNELGNEGCQRLFEFLCTNEGRRHAIQEISLNANNIGDEGLLAISRYLKGNQRVRELFLQNNELRGTPTVAAAFVEAINTSRLEVLSVTTNKHLSDSFLAHFLPSLDSPYLHELQLSAIGLTSSSGKLISAYLSSPRCRLHVLKCNGNSLGLQGIKPILRVMQSRNYTLRSIELFANQLQDEETESESEDSSDENTSGRTIVLTKNDIQTWKDCEALVKKILLRNTHLKREVNKQAVILLHYARPLLLEAKRRRGPVDPRVSSQPPLQLPYEPWGYDSGFSRFYPPFQFRSLPLELQHHILSFLSPSLSSSQRIRVLGYATAAKTLPSLLPPLSTVSRSVHVGNGHGTACIPDPSSIEYALGGTIWPVKSHRSTFDPICTPDRCMGSSNSLLCRREKERIEFLENVGELRHVQTSASNCDQGLETPSPKPPPSPVVRVMHLYLGSNPRTLYLITDEKDELLGRPRRALRFRLGKDRSQAIVALLPTREVDHSNLVKLTNRTVKGCLGLINVENDIFLAVVTSAVDIGNTRPSAHEPESVARIHEVCFYSLTSSTWDDPLLNEARFGPEAVDSSFRETYTNNVPVFEHPCMPLTKILSSGTFYYATEPTWDLSSRLSVRLGRDAASSRDIGTFDERFVWNEYILRSLLDFRERLDFHEREEMDRCQFLILAIQGYVGVLQMPLRAPPTDGAPTIATLAIISRLSWKRAGTRFNTRGVDDDGNCANFVETETVFSTDQHCVSYVQVRGSVPLFWEQQGLQTFGQRIQITRPHASQPAFERHFVQLMEEYGSIHVINLLGSKENEALLTSSYARHLSVARNALGDNLGLTSFDFHHAVRIGGHESVIRNLPRMESVADNIDKFGFTMCDASTDEIITEQKGVFRTNCLDCLDRTNFVEDVLSKTTLEQYLGLVRREWLASMQLWTNHRELWAENGDALSRIYAGTGALNTSFTRTGKQTLAGLLSDATKSVSRAYINNFQDRGKQIAIDMFLGNLSDQKQVTIFDPIHDTVDGIFYDQKSQYNDEYMEFEWTVHRPDMIVLGFQEIVPLTAQQIVQTDPEKRRLWEKKVMENIERKPNRKSRYVILRSEQLVGTALFVMVKEELTSVIRNVEGTSRKTGLRGMSGNKGAVGIRLDYYDTNFCFLTAHLAAGHTNIEERNADYRTIVNGLRFQKGKTIASHDNVIWLADTNYRIDLDNAAVRSYAEADDFDPLVAADQLRYAMDTGLAFTGYEEGPLLFRPTYRYDVGTDNYDTSEKMRIPAWTDRILYRGPALDLAVYSRSELRGSDHRPVFAIFRADIRIVDTVKKAALSQLLLEHIVSTQPYENLDEKLASISLPEAVGELPDPSTDDKAWWDTPDGPGGLVSIEEIHQIDLSRKGNPFESPLDSPLSASPTTSDEELYTSALALQTPLTPVPVGTRRPPPPPPPRAGKD